MGKMISSGRKLNGRTRTGAVFLTLSFLAWCGYIAYWNVQLGKTESGLAMLVGVWGTGLLVSVAATPLMYLELFKAQAQRKIAGVLVGAVFVLGCLVYEYLEQILSIVRGGACDSEMILTMLVGLVVPFTAILAALTSFRPLAIIGAILCIPATIYSVQALRATHESLSAIADEQALDTLHYIAIGAEIALGVGQFWGLLGIQRVKE